MHKIKLNVYYECCTPVHKVNDKKKKKHDKKKKAISSNNISKNKHHSKYVTYI